MEGRLRPSGMSAEEFAEAQHLFEATEQAVADERWRMCCLMAGKRDREMLGHAEFQLRELVHRVGAITLQRTRRAPTAAQASPVFSGFLRLGRTGPSTAARGGSGRLDEG